MPYGNCPNCGVQVPLPPPGRCPHCEVLLVQSNTSTWRSRDASVVVLAEESAWSQDADGDFQVRRCAECGSTAPDQFATACEFCEARLPEFSTGVPRTAELEEYRGDEPLTAEDIAPGRPPEVIAALDHRRELFEWGCANCGVSAFKVTVRIAEAEPQRRWFKRASTDPDSSTSIVLQCLACNEAWLL
jgi:hypothetical protein